MNSRAERIRDVPRTCLSRCLSAPPRDTARAVRFNTEFILQQDPDGVTSWVRERDSGREYAIRSAYLIGADGANSRVVEQAAPAARRADGRVRIDQHRVRSRFLTFRRTSPQRSVLGDHQPGSASADWALVSSGWSGRGISGSAIWGYEDAENPPQIDEAFAKRVVHNLIGDDTVRVTIESTSTWTVNDMYATELSAGRIYCVGDAVHRHPPTNGLGSNHSIQDAYNLAWKMALVLGGKAGTSLLASYDAERAPIAKQTVTRANQSLNCFPPILGALGLFDTQDRADAP